MQSPSNSQRRLIIILALIVLLPMILLAWQGWKISKDTEKLNTARFNSLVTARLNQVDTVIQSYFEEMQLKWSLLIPQWQLDKSKIRELVENDGNIRQIFVINAQQIRTFPPQDTEITQAENSFVNRLATVWRDPQILFSDQNSLLKNDFNFEQLAKFDAIASKVTQKKQKQNSKTIIASSNSSISTPSNASFDQAIELSEIAADSSYQIQIENKPTRKATKISKNSVGSNQKQGWYMWHWGNDANLIFWQQNRDNSIVGVEMEPIRVKADLISRLPDTSTTGSEDFRVRLFDTAGHVVYQWGNFQTIDRQTIPRQRQPVSYPLSSWSLEYYGNTFSQQGLSRFTLLISLLGFSLLISALAWFLYREQTREIRLATQRVDFVSQVSHELKTPLTNIRMYAEMLEQQVEESEKPRRYVQVITDESKRLSRLISNVLNFSRAPRIHKRDVVIDDIIKQSLEHFVPSFEAKNIAINTTLQAQTVVKTDPDVLEQILNNLLSNVEKYAASGKQVDISSEIKNNQFCICVRDYGLGISHNVRKDIFKPFYRINDKITEGVSGTGIGLTIAKQQAEHLGGSLSYIDVEPGACFELQIDLDV